MTAARGARARPRPTRLLPGEPERLWRPGTPDPDHVPDPRPAEERLAALHRPPLLDYPRAHRARRAIAGDALWGRPGGWTLLHGPAGNGRSAVAASAAALVERHAPAVRGRAFAAVHMPPRPTPDRLWRALWRSLQGRSVDLPGAAAASREARAMVEIRRRSRSGLRLLVLDGCDALLDARPEAMRTMLRCADQLTAETGVRLLLVGSTRLAARIDREAVGHHAAVELPRWRVDEDWLALLRDFEAALPLRLPSFLADREMALHLWALSDGLLGPLNAVLVGATAAAIELGLESIDVALLDDLGMAPPSSFGGFMF